MESAKYTRSQANFSKGKISRKIKAHVVIRASDNSKNIGSSILNQSKSCLKTSVSVSRLGKEYVNFILLIIMYLVNFKQKK